MRHIRRTYNIIVIMLVMVNLEYDFNACREKERRVHGGSSLFSTNPATQDALTRECNVVDMMPLPTRGTRVLVMRLKAQTIPGSRNRWRFGETLAGLKTHTTRFYQRRHISGRSIGDSKRSHAPRDISESIDRDWPIMTLERAIGDRAGSDEDVFRRGGFDGCVYPDLPLVGSSMVDSIESCITSQVKETLQYKKGHTTRDSPLWVARTVAAQCLDVSDIDTKIIRSGNLFRDCQASNQNVRGALLCVSGADPSRRLPFVNDRVKDGVHILKRARHMREHGDIPESIDLWTVANPLTDSVDSVRRKVDAGAHVILTQPPFFQKVSEAWCDGLHDIPVRLLAGVPVITSRRNLAFWFGLCGVDGSPDAYELQKTFPDSAMHQDESVYEDRVVEWNRRFVHDQILRLPALSGIHVMPVTPSGLRLMHRIIPP